MHEDVFTDNAITIVIRINQNTIATLEKEQSLSFSELQTQIETTKRLAYFIKIDDQYQKIIIPFEKENKQFEIWVNSDDRTFSYYAHAEKTKPSKMVQPIRLPHQPSTFKKKLAQFRFIDYKTSFRTEQALRGFVPCHSSA